MVLRTLEAVRLENVLEAGRTHPLVIECRNLGSDSAEEFEEGAEFSEESSLMVIKAKGLPEVKEMNLFCELFGNLLAREFGIFTPAPALINLSEEFVASINPSLQGFGLQLHAGIGVGCKFLRPLRPIVLAAYFKPEELAQAALIYGFDLLMQNPDRRQNKPNCAFYKDQIVAFDFELCFSFLFPIIGQEAPWKVSQHGINSLHFFRPALKSGKPNWLPLIHSFEKLTATRIETLLGGLPENWQTWGQQVQDHIGQVIMNADKLEFELQRSLL